MTPSLKMPELPEVETIRVQLAPQVQGRLISAAEAHPSAKFCEALEAVGPMISKVRRRGKYLIFELDDNRELIVHLGMTGQLGLAPSPNIDRYTRARWWLDDDHQLVLRDMRRFGRVRVVQTGDYESITTLHNMGPEPFDLDFTTEYLYDALRKSSRRVKTQLLSQRPVAGLGNICADEALWQARVSPTARKLSLPAAERLQEAIVRVLKSGIANGGTTLRNYRNAQGESGRNQMHLKCYGRGGEPCERCGTTLRSRQVDARTTTWCPDCQRR